MIPKFSYVRAASLTDAIELIRRTGGAVLAGGTDLLGCLRDGAQRAEAVVSISGIPDLDGIAVAPDGGLRLGALTTIDAVSRHPLIRERYTALAQAAAEVGSPQLRNQGTLAGNLCQRPRCWYFRGDFACAKKGGDTCFAVAGENRFHCIFGGGPCYIVHPSDTAPALLALDARLRLLGSGGSRTVPIADFFQLPIDNLEGETVLQPGEVVVEVLLPPPLPGQRSVYRKVRARRTWDFALTSAAIAIQQKESVVQDARIALGGVAPVPWRVTAAEEVLRSRPLDDRTLAAVAEAAIQGAQPLEQNGYKLDLVRGVLRQELARLREG